MPPARTDHAPKRIRGYCPSILVPEVVVVRCLIELQQSMSTMLLGRFIETHQASQPASRSWSPRGRGSYTLKAEASGGARPESGWRGKAIRHFDTRRSVRHLGPSNITAYYSSRFSTKPGD
eukprot:g44216.t1